ncbi:class I SAM-dependent methyltransferase [Brucella pituitosa]|uniref:class I SAM-dependent methyltransferase n=1 Tax=Brucella pituitosa TaxID=571256 RepID=UPI000C280B75|nr:class I SAM-dependent methyltransferase [Brucella pituitosa]MCK4204001.1 class I SAM-dependent methyltransferase [Brucella pituitosa]PJO45830.1 methyltransferase [Brucella pituitosa]PRA88821.1 methyltransferase [Ochrobactrum sp. MYb29]
MMTPAQETLFLPFYQDILDMPEEGQTFLACGLSADRQLEDEWKRALTFLQPWRPDWLALNKEGFKAIPRLAPELDEEKRFSGGLLLLGKHRGRNEAWFAELLMRVEPGGWIVVCGDKKLGVDSFRKWVGNIAEISDRLSKNHAVAFWLQRPADLTNDFINALKPLATDIDDVFRTEPGMFSHGAIDKGSALLVPHMEKIVFGQVADLGAGWGYLAAQSLKYADRLKGIDLFEADYEALETARGNLERLGASVPVSFNWFDVTSEKLTGIYDTVIMNPPFHEGRATDMSLGQTFIAAAASRLKIGGRLLMVANRQLPYEATLKGLFKNVTVLEEANGFKIFDGKK